MIVRLEKICDALFLSLSFTELDPSQLSFSTKQPAKKKRKSRTAFTNHQIFELEKRFLYQKYLSPADRDEIAAALGLTNAQVSVKAVPCACDTPLTSGDYLVPKSAGQVEARHGGAAQGRGVHLANHPPDGGGFLSRRGRRPPSNGRGGRSGSPYQLPATTATTGQTRGPPSSAPAATSCGPLVGRGRTRVHGC